MKWDDKDNRDDEDGGDDRDNRGSVKCVPAKGIEVNELGVWLSGRLLNVSLMMCKGIKAYLPLILLFVESV
jgi:hypothetical protein